MSESDDPASYLAARQRVFPPIYYRTPSAWQALFGVPRDLSSAKLQRLVKAGTIVSGEVGELTWATSVALRGRGYLVQMHSGTIRLIYSAARALTASDSGRFREDKSHALSAVEVAQHVADLFRNFEAHQIGTVQWFAATEFQTGWADSVARGAEQFLLLHELAHIHNGDLAWWHRYFDFGGDSRARESAADRTACHWLIAYLRNPVQGGPQRQLLYAGAEFALRTRMAMETYGMKFEPTHPPAGDRVAAMRGQLRAAVGPREFYAIASTSLAFDQMWRAIELILRHMPPVFEARLDDVLAGLRTLTVELLKAGGADGIRIKDVAGQPGHKQVVFTPVTEIQKEILKAAERDFRDLSPSLREAVRAHVGDVFEPGCVEFSMFHMLLALSEPKPGPAGGKQ